MKKKSTELKIGALIISFYFLWAIVWVVIKYLIKGTPLIPYFPAMNLQNELALPFEKNLILGADLQGRSLLEVLSEGLAYTITISIAITCITSSIGIVVGYLAAKSNKSYNLFFDLIINIIFIFPGILIAILVMAITGQSLVGLVFALSITGWSGYAKITRGEVKRILNLSYVEASKAIGIGEIRLFFKIILPALFPIIIVNMVLGLSGVIVSEATLGFLGLGGSRYSWGAVLSNAKTVLLEAPHVTIIISLFMALLIMGLNLLGDGLRDYLDPHSK